MRAARRLTSEAPEREIASGPGKLTQALGVTLDDYGHSLLRGRLSLRRPARSDARVAVARSRRVGLSKGRALPYRFYVAGNEFVSRARRG
jgi:DNA-3-methyladenine glycosylase